MKSPTESDLFQSTTAPCRRRLKVKRDHGRVMVSPADESPLVRPNINF